MVVFLAPPQLEVRLELEVRPELEVRLELLEVRLVRLRERMAPMEQQLPGCSFFSCVSMLVVLWKCDFPKSVECF